jgi:hypothetical protein
MKNRHEDRKKNLARLVSAAVAAKAVPQNEFWTEVEAELERKEAATVPLIEARLTRDE